MAWLTGQKLVRGMIIGTLGYIVIRAADVLPVIISAVFLAFCEFPLVSWLCRIKFFGKWQLNRSIAVLTAFLLLAGIICGIVSVIIYPVLAEIRQLYGQIPYYISMIKAMVAVVNEELVQPLMQNGFFVEQLESCLMILQQTIAGSLSMLMKLVRNAVGFSMQAVGQIIDFVAIPILAFYFVRDWDIIRDSFIVCFSEKRRDLVKQLAEDAARIIKSFLYGQLMLCIVVGLLMFGAMLMLGMEYPFLLGLNAALFEAIPVIGPMMGAIPAVFLALLVSPWLAVRVAGLCIVIQLVENNLLSPRIMGSSLNIHPAAVMISLLVGGNLWGVIGMIVSLPTVAMLNLLLKYFWNIGEER